MKGLLILSNNYLEKNYLRIIDHTYISTQALSVYRIFLGVYVLFNFKGYSWLGDVPPGFFKPNVFTLAKLFNTFPNPIYFKTTDILIYILIIMIIVGIKTRVSFLILAIIMIVNNSFVYSFGKIDHGIFSIVILLFFAFTNSGTTNALKPDGFIKTEKLAIAIFAITLAFAFFTAGYKKIFVWIDLDLSTSGVFYWYYPGYFNLGRTHLLAPYFLYTPIWLAEIMDYTAVIFEISGIAFLLYSRRSWYIYLIIACIFHLANTLVLNITFSNHFVIYGLWLLSPLLVKNKFLFTLPLLLFLFPEPYLGLIFWISILIVSIYCWNRGLYNFQKTVISYCLCNYINKFRSLIPYKSTR